MSNNSSIFPPIPFFLHFFNTPLLLIIFNKDIITVSASQEAKFYVSLGIAGARNK
jgi:hypothetical protein